MSPPRKPRRHRRKDETQEQYRTRVREQQRARRARFYAAGLSNSGKPLLRHDLAAALRTNIEHPADCLCHDCLWPSEPYEPSVHRIQLR